MKSRWPIAPLALSFALAAAALLAAPADPAGAPDGVGTDLESDQRCLGCHWALQEAWQRGSSHALLFDCRSCHPARSDDYGPAHTASTACAECHSQRAHPPGAACTDCHQPHGSSNAFLLRPAIDLPGGGIAYLHLTAPQGAGQDGLTRTGVEGAIPGTGPCEVCHLDTRYYNRAGTGQPHPTEWCAHCHDHQQGFAPQPR